MGIFTEKLAEVLATHRVTLDDIPAATTISRQKIRQLQRAKPTQKAATLQPQELDTLKDAFALTDDEMLMLHAAILAAALEGTITSLYQGGDVLHISSMFNLPQKLSRRVYSAILDYLRYLANEQEIGEAMTTAKGHYLGGP